VLAATVLVAEDDADILRFVEINLRLEGLEVVTARDGPDALAKAAAVRPGLVLLDVQMPGIDGYTICARIRADASLAAVRVIIVTANYGSADVQAARRAGADDFLVKPSAPPRSSTWPRPCSAGAGDSLTSPPCRVAPRGSGAATILALGGAAAASWAGGSFPSSFHRP
jgi:CheY-like chemotaxis protein